LGRNKVNSQIALFIGNKKPRRSQVHGEGRARIKIKLPR
jgi:hypothetical protein